MALFNQTPSEWQPEPNSTALGTGVILEAVTQEDGRTATQVLQATYVEDVTFEQCQSYALDKVAFKWIPHSVASIFELRTNACGGRCVDSCVVPGCICNPLGVCQKPI
jgi:hypothetical protein